MPVVVNPPSGSRTTLAGAIKTLLDSKLANVPVYRDSPPSKQTNKRPYCTVVEGIAVTMDGWEDGGPGSGVPTPSATGTELVQIDLWQDWRDGSDQVLESTTLADQITEVMDGAQLPTAPKRVYGVYQQGRVRIVDRNSNIVHVAYTFGVRRVI